MQNDATKSALAGASSLLALAITTPAAAQENSSGEQDDGEELKEVTVTGLRVSLQRNLDTKRDVGGRRRRDLGRGHRQVPGFERRRLAAASARRFDPARRNARRADRHHGARLRRATSTRLLVRRPANFDGGGRALGGLQHGRRRFRRRAAGDEDSGHHPVQQPRSGATVNVQFPKPFDHPGPRFVATAAALACRRPATPGRPPACCSATPSRKSTLGILVNGIYTDHSTTSNSRICVEWEGGRFRPASSTAACTGTQNADANHTIVGWWQQQYGAEQSAVSDKRIDGRIAFQWRPSDRLLVTLDDNYSPPEAARRPTDGFALWFGLNDLRSVSLD